MLPFTGVPKNARRLHVQRAPDLLRRQRRRCGPATRDSDTPAAHVDGERRGEQLGRQLGLQPRRSRSSRSSSAALGLLVGGVALVAGRRSRHEDRRAGEHAARRLSRLRWRCRRWRGDTPRCSPRNRRRAACSPNRQPRCASPTASASSRASPSSRSRTPRVTSRSWAAPATAPDDENSIFIKLKPPRPGLVPRLVARDLGRRAPRARRLHVRGRAEPRPAAAVRDPLARGERGHAEPRHLALGAAARAAGVRRPARLPRRDRAAAAGEGRERARPARRHARRGRSRSPSRSSPRRSTSCWRPRSSHSDPGPISARSCRSCATRASGAPSAISGACSRCSPWPRRSRWCSTVPAGRAAPARRCSPSSARRACAAAALALPGPCRSPVDDQPGRA